MSGHALIRDLAQQGSGIGAQGRWHGASRRAQAPGGRVRLRTLSNLRWLAIAGQSAALFLVYFALGYPLPILYCAVAIAVSAALNIVLALALSAGHRLTNREATFYLAFDVLQLAALLYLTGGIANPFALMFLAPVVIAAATLNLGNTLILACIAFASVSLIAIVHQPLPWPAGRSAAAAAALSGGHLGGAGDRHRLHLGLCLAHRVGIGAHVGGPGGDAAGAVARASPGGAGRAGHGGGA